MAYMAVGSRQILFSDVAAPAAPRDDAREVASLSDNTQAEARTPAAAPAPSTPAVTEAGDPGHNFEARA